MVIFSVNKKETSPYDGQKPGTSGLRKKVTVFKQQNYLHNFVQATFDALSVEKIKGSTIVVSGDGRYFSEEAIQIIIKMAAANGVRRVWVGQNGLLSTPAVSAVIRNRIGADGEKASGSFILTASHNAGGPNEDFGIKYNMENGGPAPEGITDKIYENTKTIKEYFTAEDLPDVDISTIGITTSPLIRVSGNKRAVLCGISYKNTKHELKGCINDVNCMKYLLMTKFSFPEDSIIVLTEEEEDSKRIPTRQNMQRWMRWLVQDCRAGDSLVFHYSGHGSQQEEDYSGEEVDGYDETLLPVDFETAGMIVDNEINETLVRPLPPGARLHAIIDACHSGTVLDLPYLCVFNPRQGNCAWEDHTPQNGVCKATSGGEAISFSGCEDDQTSADTKALSKIQSTGAMTFSFIKAVEKGEGKTYGTLLSYMRDSVRAARQKPKNPTVLTNMLYEGGSQKQGKIQEPQLSSSYPFDINEKPFYL